MSKVKLGNGASLESYLRGAVAKTKCDCIGGGVGLVLSSLTMAGSNLYYLYNGERCSHGEPIRAANVAYIVDNFYEKAIKIKGKTDISGWLNQMLKGSVALVFFRSNGVHSATALDLYLGNGLWLNSGVAELADEMWVWAMGTPHPKLKAKQQQHHHHHNNNKHHSSIRMF